jgi:hypothetical protein
MATEHSKVTEKDTIVVRRAGRFSSEDIHRALFSVSPQSHSIEELKAGIRRNVRKRHARH